MFVMRATLRERVGKSRVSVRVVAGAHSHSAVIARLDRAIQYAETAVMDREAAARWIPRFRGE